MKALLIIDMQIGSFKPYSLRHDTIGTIERINLLSERFRDDKQLVIFIQHDGSRENSFIPQTDDWQILPELKRLPEDLFVSKTANDSFYNSELNSVLVENDITELFITGCATDFCVDSTVKSALTKDFKVTIISDGHTTASRPFIDAETTINHYNWLWADMTPTKYKLTVVKTKELTD
nr:cysteine hydrolase family protein [uncultured Fluviicola sp.]